MCRAGAALLLRRARSNARIRRRARSNARGGRQVAPQDASVAGAKHA
ncbi:hypothetical protein HMPREF1868_01878 [Olsenella sp. DNF00959]|nr:hypothetical protein HMPREF1868_01878 [Olsenella sp. DNF00959]